VELGQLAEATGEREAQPGFSCSDLRERLLPALALEAFPESPLRAQDALSLATRMEPTPGFQESDARPEG
jgi:hypothetical protein